MAAVLKVNPEILEGQATEFSSEVAKIKNAMNQIGSYIKGTKKYWQGDASDSHIQKYQTIEIEINEVIKKLEKTPKDLLQITGIYKSTETENNQIAMSLPTDALL